MLRFLLCLCFCCYTMYSLGQKNTKPVEITFDTVRVSGYLIKTSSRYNTFFLASNDPNYHTIGEFLDRYFPVVGKYWDPKYFKSSDVYIFNPDTSLFSSRINNADGYDFFQDDDLYFPGLNKLAQKKILPKLISKVKYKKRKDAQYRTYEVFYLEGRWLRFKLKYGCKDIRSPNTIIPDCSKGYFYCYILYDYNSLLPLTYLDDKRMYQVGR